MILDRIRQELYRLSERQKRVASFVLSNYEDAAFLTAAKLAEASDVSEATVIRFVNRIGYDKYSELQTDLRDVIRGKLSQADRFDRSGDLKNHSTTMQTVIRSMRTDIRSIERTLMSINEKELETIVKRISTARRVYVAGTHSEYGIACYFASTLGWVRDDVYQIESQHSTLFDTIADMNEKDVFVAMSFPPYPAATVRYLEAAMKRKAHGVAITDSPLSPLAVRADNSLYAYDDKLFYADNSAPTVSLLAVILALVGSYNFEASSAKLKNYKKYWEEIDFYHQEKS